MTDDIKSVLSCEAIFVECRFRNVTPGPRIVSWCPHIGRRFSLTLPQCLRFAHSLGGNTVNYKENYDCNVKTCPDNGNLMFVGYPLVYEVLTAVRCHKLKCKLYQFIYICFFTFSL